MRVVSLVKCFCCSEFRQWNERIRQGTSPVFAGWLLTILLSCYVYGVLTLRTPSIIWMPIALFPLWLSFVTLCVVVVGNRLCDVSWPPSMPFYGRSISLRRLYVIVAGVYLTWIVIAHTNSIADVEIQMDQARRFCFNDWHPIIHSLIMAPLLGIYDGLVSIVVLQVLLMALLGCWLLSTLRKMINPQIALLISLFVIFNPVNFVMIRTGLKDVAFAFAALGIVISLLNIQRTKGSWLNSWKNVIGVAILLFGASFLRHNGFFFTVPLALLMMMWPLVKGCRVRIWVTLLVAFGLSWGYVALKRSPYVQGHFMERPSWIENQNLGEVVGVPMCGILRAYCRDYARVPDDVKLFVESIAPREKLLAAYTGDYNSVKFINVNPPSGLFSADRMTFGRVIDMFVRTLKSCHMATFNGIRDVTALVWDPFHRNHYVEFSKGTWFGREVYWIGNILLSPPWGWLFFSVGLYMMVFVVLATIGFVFRGWKAWMYALPWLGYGFGTMMLLCGSDWRFFYGFILCAPVATTAICIKDR